MKCGRQNFAYIFANKMFRKVFDLSFFPSFYLYNLCIFKIQRHNDSIQVE